MEIVKQTENTCGQACIAMLLNISLDESIKLFNHDKPTSSRDIISVLESRNIGYSELQKINKTISDIAIIKRKLPNTNQYHWVLKHYDKIYEPHSGMIYKYNSHHWLNGEYIEIKRI